MSGRDEAAADPRRRLPSVDRLLGRADTQALVAEYGREPVTNTIREVLRELRGSGESVDVGDGAVPILERVTRKIAETRRPGLRRVLNGTGVVLHTNLGRARLDAETMRELLEYAGGYSNLEYDLDAGKRGDRYAHCADRLRDLLGAEDALVVNNTAAALVLVVNEFARDREVIVSRGELVEIGGGFRIPDMIERGGGRLVEVGTTNRTRIEDYRAAVGDRTGLLLKVHPSNYRIDGFTDEVSVGELAGLGRDRDVPVAWDLGSATPRPILPDELAGPPPASGGAESGGGAGEATGPDLVMWSGDKLLGGPQAGILHGRAPLIDRLRRNPLLRAFRVDKLTLAVLEAALITWSDEERTRARNPTIRALLESAESVRVRAERTLEHVAPGPRDRIRVVESRALVGAGSAPGQSFASAAWAIDGPADRLDDRCRHATPPLIGRIESGRYLLDFRCLTEEEAAEAARIVASVLVELAEEPGS